MWLDNIKLKCSHGGELDSKSLFTDSAFIKTGLVSSIFGAYFGILYDSSYMNGTKPSINNTSVVKGLFRLLVGLMLLGPLLTPYMIMGNQYSVGTLYTLKCAVPFFMVTFLMFSWLKRIYEFFGLVDSY